jgi:hypothetical protein
MNTRKALGIFTGCEGGDTFLSDPRAVEHFSRMAATRQAEIQRRQQQPQMSLPHVRLAADKAQEAMRTALLDATVPLVDKFSAYQVAKKCAAQAGSDGGLRALAQQMRVRWESDPDGFYSAADLVRLREHFSHSFGRTAAVDVLSNAIPKAGVGDLPVRKLTQLASQIQTQMDYETVCKQAGLDGNRPDQVRARAYLRALVRHAADDVMAVDVNEQQGPQLEGISADNGGGVLSAADLKVKQANLPTEKQVAQAVLDANTVRLAGYSLFVNDSDLVELRTPRGASRLAPISKLSGVVRDFLRIAQSADFEPSVNEQQAPVVDLNETEGGDVLGKDSTTDEKATNAIIPAAVKEQHPMQNNSGTSTAGKELGADSETVDPSWSSPKLSGPHASDPHLQQGTSFADGKLGPDRQQDETSWENPGPIVTSRAARLDDSLFLASRDPADRYRCARENRPSAKLLEGIGDPQGWLARRVLAQFEDVEPEEQKEPPAEEQKEPRMAQLREDVYQIGDGLVDRSADTKYTYTFGYDRQLGQPRLTELQRYIDTCCGGVRAYRVATLSPLSPGVVQATVLEARALPFVGDRREAVRRAMGKDFGNDPAGAGSDYAGTILNKEGDSPEGWMKDRGYEPDKSKEGTQTAIKPVTDVPSLQPKEGARITEGWGEGGEYKRDIEAENAQEVWELHRGLGGEKPEFQQQQQAQATAPIEPRQDAGGKVQLPEPEPEALNAQRVK